MAPFIHVVLYEPEIPPNTGNLIRLTANAPCALHLVHPMGFNLSDKQVKRAGLDYHDLAHVHEYADWQTCRKQHAHRRCFAFSTKGARSAFDIDYRPGDMLLFGPETRGLPDHVMQDEGITEVVRLPMLPTSRSLNLSNTAAIAVYEMWRQLDFDEGAVV